LSQSGCAPHVVLMDVRMPRMDGVQATEQLRARFPAVRVMLLTTFDDEELIMEGLRAGATGYLLKDVTAEQLVEAVRPLHRGEAPLQSSVDAKVVARPAQTPGTSSKEPAETSAPTTAMAQSRKLDGLLVDELTDREREILRYVARGNNNREIGEALFITEGTVKNHV